MTIAQILTPWAGDGSESNPYHPQLSDDYAILKYEDTTGQAANNLVPNPNLFVVQIEAEDAVFASILSDDNYHVLWDQPNPRSPDSVPYAAEFGLLRAFLARSGVKQATITAVIGNNPSGRTRAQIADTLRAWLVTLPKG